MYSKLDIEVELLGFEKVVIVVVNGLEKEWLKLSWCCSISEQPATALCYLGKDIYKNKISDHVNSNQAYSF
jgi:hypothetical protein